VRVKKKKRREVILREQTKWEREMIEEAELRKKN
jgi:hypothetical protein